MKPLLGRFAILLGGACATVSLAWNLWNGMDLLIAAFRFALVFFSSVIVLFLFLHLFSTILIRFVAEKVLEQRSQADPANPAASSRPSSTRPPSGSAAPPRSNTRPSTGM